MAAFYMFPLGLRQLRISSMLMDMSFLAKEKLSAIKTFNIIEDSSGKEGDLEWSISSEDFQPFTDIKLRKVILKVSCDLETKKIEEEFITYFRIQEEAQE